MKLGEKAAEGEEELGLKGREWGMATIHSLCVCSSQTMQVTVSTALLSASNSFSMVTIIIKKETCLPVLPTGQIKICARSLGCLEVCVGYYLKRSTSVLFD